jgi:hypothetical protein
MNSIGKIIVAKYGRETACSKFGGITFPQGKCSKIAAGSEQPEGEIEV